MDIDSDMAVRKGPRGRKNYQWYGPRFLRWLPRVVLGAQKIDHILVPDGCLWNSGDLLRGSTAL